MSDTTDLLDAALKLYGAYTSSQPGKFLTVPQDPAQTAMKQKVLGYVDNSPTRDIFQNLISQRLGSARTSFTPPPGANGYNPFAGGTAPTGSTGSGGYDLGKIFGTNTTAKPPVSAFNPDGTPTNNYPNVSPGLAGPAPAGGGQRNIADQQDLMGGLNGSGPRDNESIGDYLTRNPGGNANQYLPNGGAGSTVPQGGQNMNTGPIDALTGPNGTLPPEVTSTLGKLPQASSDAGFWTKAWTFSKQYGVGALMTLGGILTANPKLTFDGGVNIYHSYQKGQTPVTPPQPPSSGLPPSGSSGPTLP